ncbi:hypothetical protein L7F22_041925 [Adiantum nelumboides]|nr:hypothetical protein [Adiantum nelumboides]
MAESFSYCHVSHKEMNFSPMHPSPPLRIQHQWSSKAALFCSQRSLKATQKSTNCGRHPYSPTAMALSGKVFHGECFVLQDNIDTDQIIPAEHLTLVPSKPDEYEKLGSLALCGLPSPHPRFVMEGEMKTKYPIIVAGSNFGCGSSREHAPVALGASGVRAVVAESYARIFFRNSVATGELYPVESECSLSKEFKTGDVVTLDLDHNVLINHTQKKQYTMKPLGDAGPVIDAGGLFAFARKTGMIASSPA